MKRRMVFSDDHELSMIPGCTKFNVNAQPKKVQRQFELGFTAKETHFLSYDYSPPSVKQPIEHPKVEDDPDALEELEKYSKSMEDLCKDIELLEQELMSDS